MKKLLLLGLTLSAFILFFPFKPTTNNDGFNLENIHGDFFYDPRFVTKAPDLEDQVLINTLLKGKLTYLTKDPSCHPKPWLSGV